ncbi:uncharacterized protein LOC134466069 [Engraulis encrasicolus]|uniref:uncharacterized protein LOC134466069 n=1 Tax=Engraulis encrasicolus TaxID=184585 RepID=UPI002FD31F7C
MERELLDLSKSFEDCGLKDVSFVLPSSQSSSSAGTMSGSGSISQDTERGWGQRKWLVNESNLLQLFQTCPSCMSLITETTITTKGSQIKIKWSCGRHSGEWQSCPDRRGMAENNLLISASILFTGATYTDVADWANLLNMSIPTATPFYDMQRIYLRPAIQDVYKRENDRIISRLAEESTSGKRHELCGDGRRDSPVRDTPPTPSKTTLQKKSCILNWSSDNRTQSQMMIDQPPPK